MPRTPSPGPSEIEPSTIRARRVGTKVLRVDHPPCPSSEGARSRRPLGETEHVEPEVNSRRSPASPRTTICDDMSMRHSAWRAELLVGVVLVGTLGTGATACSSSGPSTAATGLCGTVSGPFPGGAAVAVDTQSIRDGEISGNTALDQVATAILKALHEHSFAAIAAANDRLAGECERLGIPTATLNP